MKDDKKTSDVQALTDAAAICERQAERWPNDDRACYVVVECAKAIRAAALATPSPAPQALTADLLADLKVQYGMVGTSDVDVTAWNAKLDRAIAALAGAPAVQPAEPPRGFQWGLEVRRAIADLVDAEKALHSAAPPPAAVPAQPAESMTSRLGMTAANLAGRTSEEVVEQSRGAQQEPAWRPMLSAPTDGARVLLHRDEWGESMAVGFWNSDFRHWSLIGGGSPFYEPTSWMLLPAPPNEAGPESGAPVPEGCTPADARVLRFANALAQESDELQDALADLYGQVKRFCETQGEADFETGRALYLLSRLRPMEFHWPFAIPPNVSSGRSGEMVGHPTEGASEVPPAPAEALEDRWRLKGLWHHGVVVLPPTAPSFDEWLEELDDAITERDHRVPRSKSGHPNDPVDANEIDF